MPTEDIGERLTVEPRRQATDALRGYLYQIWHSLHAWLCLRAEEALYLETAEDFDIHNGDAVRATQVKNTAKNITLRSTEICEAVINAWTLITNNPEKHIAYHFLTTSDAGVEQGNPFGPGVSGLMTWGKCAQGKLPPDRLLSFLRKEDRYPETLMKFLNTSTDEVVIEKLIRPITWNLNAPNMDAVTYAVERKLISLGEHYSIFPSEAKKMVDSLLRVVFEKACSEKDRSLDRAHLLEQLEAQMMQLVPRAEYQKQISILQFNADKFDTSHRGTQYIDFPDFLCVVPPTPIGCTSRSELVHSISQTLSREGVVLLYGSSGMGKTTLAKFLAKYVGASKICWVSLSDYDGLRIRSALSALGRYMDNPERHIRTIVLDDIDLGSSALTSYKDVLSGLLYTSSNMEISVIITGQRHPAARLTALYGIQDTAMIDVPALDESEVIECARQMGCTNTALARTWSQLVRIQTEGHPQLVHARMRGIASAKWPAPGLENILNTAEMEQERDYVRELFSGSDISTAHKELLYRISVLVMPFRRDHALAIGDIAPPLMLPGDLFDYLVGPWIEQVGNSCYRLSPLLRSAASSVWSKDKARLIQSSVACAIMKCGDLGGPEAQNIFLLGWQARDRSILFSIVQALTLSTPDRWEPVARSFQWFLHVNTSCMLFEEDSTLNSLLRAFQVRIAAHIDPESGVLLFDRWRNEIPESEIGSMLKYMYYMHVLLFHQIPVSPDLVVSSFINLRDVEKHSNFSALIDSSDLTMTSDVTAPTSIEYGALFSFVILRCKNLKYLSDLFNAIFKAPPSLREVLLGDYERHPHLYMLLLSGAWLNEAEQDNPDWILCLSVYKEIREMARGWKLDELEIAADRCRIIVLEEYMHDLTSALSIGEEYRQMHGSLAPGVQDQIATALFHAHHFSDALNLWEALIPSFSAVHHIERDDFLPENTMPGLAYQRAAISAARIDRWGDAAKYFHLAYQHAVHINDSVSAVGNLADAAFASMKCGDHSDSVIYYRAVLDALQDIPISQDNASSFVVHKLIGHAMNWVAFYHARQPTDLFEPPPGFCGRREYSKEILTLPITPQELFWLLLLIIELYTHVGTDNYDELEPRIRQCNIPAFRSMLSSLVSIPRAFMRADFSGLPLECDRLAMSLSESKHQASIGSHPIWCAPDSEALSSCPIDYTPPTELIVIGLIACVGAGQDCNRLIEDWRCQSASVHDRIGETILLAQKLLHQELHDALVLMNNQDQDAYVRVLSALRVCRSRNAPSDAFIAHLLIVLWMSRMPLAEHAGCYVSSLVCRQWQELVLTPALLLSPHITVPAIIMSCNTSKQGLSSAASILLAASDSVTVRIDGDTRANLKRLSE